MEEDKHIKEKRAKMTPDRSLWTPSIASFIGIFLALLFIALAIVLGVTTGIGLLFAVPLGLLALVIVLMMFRGKFRNSAAVCPHCGERINFPSHMAEFNCPTCTGRIIIRDRKLVRYE